MGGALGGQEPSTAPWTPTSAFYKYTDKGEIHASVTTPDAYVPPTSTSGGTGFKPFDDKGNPTLDYGLQITLKLGDSKGSPVLRLVPGPSI